MSIFLAGAGPDAAGFPEVFDRFAEAVRQHAAPGRTARIAVAVHHRDRSLQDVMGACSGPLRARLDCAILPVPLAAGTPADPAAFRGVDGVVVGAD